MTLLNPRCEEMKSIRLVDLLHHEELYTIKKMKRTLAARARGVLCLASSESTWERRQLIKISEAFVKI
jgi:hypothetical protein